MNAAPDVWLPVDPLGEALHSLRMSGAFYCRSEFTAPWGLALPAMPQCLMLHVVTAGEPWLEMDGRAPLQLREFDLLLVPHGHGHSLSSRPGVLAAPLFDLPREYAAERFELIRHGGGGAATGLVCAAVRFDHPAAQRLVALLPPVLHVRDADSPGMQWVRGTLQFIAQEARDLRPGGETVITRLADILVIQAIRHWIARDPAARDGWLGALQDKQIGRAIAQIHRDPARDWTLAEMAQAAAMSRSAFAARFNELVGEPAMHYLARWRMHVGLTWLREGDRSIAEIAEKLGYQSEAAFNRAFKRVMGVTPGAARQGAAVLEPAQG
ncbi:AraC family transcriptional regulator [Lysobacter sp. K5869]|uniref:AraC family transcriptional regulator n=1 Tax=Lysobacter sp. K5869 TaxID=2820808 RepID=UPI001C05F78B|nr:AraC family transcriptional regulator [Lysobacter sp. K5869]QWP76110.1 AraC family transcriptional regulator [Lysobacter sp. K5869]